MSSDQTTCDIFTPAVTKRASEVVYEQIRQAILEGAMPVGSKLPSERSLSASCKRSIPTIREALRILESSGYIEVTPGGGATVKSLTPSMASASFGDLLTYHQVSIAHILEYMREMESILVWDIAGTFSMEQCNVLKKNLEYLMDGEEPRIFLSALFSFHSALLHGPDRVFVLMIWDTLIKQIEGAANSPEGEALLHTAEKNRRKLIQAHSDLFVGLCNGDKESSAASSAYCWGILQGDIGLLKEARKE